MKKLLILVILTLALVTVFASTAFAASQSSSETSKEIQQMLLSPSSADIGITVYNNPDSTSDQIRAEIDQKLAAGESKEQIINDFVAKYGQSILTKPQTHGAGLGAWILPPVFIIVGVGAVYIVIKRNNAKQKVEPKSTIKPSTSDNPDLDKEILRYL